MATQHCSKTSIDGFVSGLVSQVFLCGSSNVRRWLVPRFGGQFVVVKQRWQE